MTSALTFRGVTKRYGRRGAKALDSMSFSIPHGCIAGFVGPNGAGKTTAFSVVCGFLSPDEGEVDVLGRGRFDPVAFKGEVGVLPQDAELPDRHTPIELLTHLAMLQGFSRRDAKAESHRLVEVVSLGDRRNARIATLSHGMRRRVAVASALCGSPKLVLLDEPLAGLDPAQAYSLRDRLAALRGQQTLVVSSHNLGEIERLCDWVVMVRDGRCLREGPTVEMTGATEVSRWELGPGVVDLEALRELLPQAVVESHKQVLTVRTAGDADETAGVVMEWLVAAAVPLRGLSRGMGLERRFLDDQEGS